MAINGIMTDSIDQASVIIELLGNTGTGSAKSTALIAVNDFATQLIGSGPLSQALSAASEGMVLTELWPALAAIPPTRNGQPGYVTLADSGTHADPVVGGTVPNQGTYSGSLSPLGWRRIGDYVDSSEKADQADLVQEIAERQAADNLLEADLLQETVERQIADNGFDVRLDIIEPLLTALYSTYGYGISQLLLENLSTKFARSGYDAPTYGPDRRILTALRKRDDTYIVGARGLETSGHRLIDDPRYLRSGMIGAIIDRDGKVIRGQRPSVDREIVGAGGIETAYQAWNGIDSRSRRRSKFGRATVSGSHQLVDGVDSGGAPYIEGQRVLTPADVAQDYVVSIKIVGTDQHVVCEHRATGARLQLTVAGTIATNPRVERDGTVTWEQIGTAYASQHMWSPASIANPHRVFPMAEILLVGDSLVEQNYGSQLATLAGIPVRNLGKSASTSRNAAARVGAIPMRLASTSGQIPASGSVEVSSPDGLAVLSYFADMSVSNIPGTWGGMAGTLSWDLSTGQMTFARTAGGSAIAARGGLPFIPTLVDSLTSAAIPELLERICVFQFGRNNLHQPERILADIKACVAAIPTRDKRFIIVLPMPTKTEVTTSAPDLHQYYLNYLILRDLVQASFPLNYIDLLSVMIANATSSTDDLAAVAGGYAPPSLMDVDEIHPNSGGKTVEATALYTFITTKGWL